MSISFRPLKVIAEDGGQAVMWVARSPRGVVAFAAGGSANRPPTIDADFPPETVWILAYERIETATPVAENDHLKARP